eukprot:CAMPEP_0185756110 /NCGR_PEP_ID=MMETSP1174-20130828/14555_1 /TAXON_ID=35687 /ORGANISM="Dictyocha speculum, Strain CCMP1381" /LENGTH=167 /DNA_ID=CAMNT_0028434929 /DNA_START=53 /DNA_END=556 /DNA_ORIENTATION=-
MSFQVSSVDDYDFSGSNAGAAETIPMKAGHVKKGGYIMMNKRPCKVSEIQISKPGKHGSSKCRIFAKEIFTGLKHEDTMPSHETVSVPSITLTDFSVIHIEGGFLSLMDDHGLVREDLALPNYPSCYAEELEEFIKHAEETGVDVRVTVLGACSHEQIMSHKLQDQE